MLVLVFLAFQFGSATLTFAQDGRYGMPDLLATLARGDISSIPQDPYNYFAVSMILAAIGYTDCTIHEPQYSRYKPLLGKITARFQEKSKSVSHLLPGSMGALLHPRYREALQYLKSRGCDSDEVQAVLENGLRFGLGENPVDNSAVFPLKKSTVSGFETWIPLAGNCNMSNRKDDPACAKIIAFYNHYSAMRPVWDEETKRWIPYGGEEGPLYIKCAYKSLQGDHWRVYYFWYQKVIDDLSSYAVAGDEHPFSVLGNKACMECPKDSDEAEKFYQSNELSK